MKKILILLFLVLSLIKFSYADSFTVNVPDTHGGYTPVIIQSSGSGYTGPGGEYYANFPTVQQLQLKYGVHSAAEQQQVIDQQIKQSEQKMDATQKQWQADEKKQQDEAVFKTAHPFGIPTPSEQKKIDSDWIIMGWFAGILLFIALGFLVFILLLHIPNRILGPNHPIHNIPLSVAVRQGMTKAQFNTGLSKILIGEIIIVSIFIGVGFKSIVAFGAALLILFILMRIKTSAFIFIYLFSVYWMMLAAEVAYAVCGGQLTTMGNYISAWVGGYIFAILGFAIAWAVHTSGLQYLEDIGS